MKEMEKIKEHCEFLMNDANHREKLARLDYNPHEESHQQGRWHALNDLLEYIESIEVK